MACRNHISNMYPNTFRIGPQYEHPFTSNGQRGQHRDAVRGGNDEQMCGKEVQASEDRKRRQNDMPGRGMKAGGFVMS